MKQKPYKKVEIPDANDPQTYKKTILFGGIAALLGPIMLIITFFYATENLRYPLLAISCLMGFTGISSFTRGLTMYLIAKKNQQKDEK